MRTHRRIPLLALLMVALVGCGGGGAPAADQAAPADQASASTSAPEQPDSGSSAAQTLSGSEITVPEGLQSYRSQLEVRFKGSQAGQAVDGALLASREHVKEPLAQRLALRSEGQLAGLGGDVQAGDFELIQIGNQAWLNAGAGWVAADQVDSTQFDQGLLSPAELLKDLEGAELVAAGETVGGVPTNHYRFSKANFKSQSGLAGAEQLSGDLWVAADGGFVVQLRMTMAGSDPLQQGGTTPFEGDISFSYQLQDLNAPLTIEPPQ